MNCPFDPAQRMLITPNGWTIPFVRTDTVIGWHVLNSNTQMFIDNKQPINDQNNRSLFISINGSTVTGRSGIVGEGYRGIPIREGEKYNLAIYVKGKSVMPKKINLALSDSTGTENISDEYHIITTPYDWRKYHHTFTATKSMEKAMLTITADTTVMFWIDAASLMPQNTWKGRSNGLRPGLMELINAIHPAFIRFPGGSFVEGYTAGTFPIWRETVGNIDSRKYFWNIYAYGSSSGVGYHAFIGILASTCILIVLVALSGLKGWSLVILAFVLIVVAAITTRMIGKRYASFTADRIHAAHQSEESFIHHASHELNNPLAAIQGECEISLMASSRLL